MPTLPLGYKISGSNIINNENEIVPRLHFDTSKKQFNLRNKDETTSFNIKPAKLYACIEEFEKSRHVGAMLSKSAPTVSSSKAKKEIDGFKEFLENTKQQLAKSKENLARSVSSQKLPEYQTPLKTMISNLIDTAYNELINIVETMNEDSCKGTPRTEISNQVNVLEKKISALVAVLDKPTDLDNKLSQVSKAFTKLRGSLVNLLRENEKSKFTLNSLEGIIKKIDQLMPPAVSKNNETAWGLEANEKEILDLVINNSDAPTVDNIMNLYGLFIKQTQCPSFIVQKKHYDKDENLKRAVSNIQNKKNKQFVLELPAGFFKVTKQDFGIEKENLKKIRVIFEYVKKIAKKNNITITQNIDPFIDE